MLHVKGSVEVNTDCFVTVNVGAIFASTAWMEWKRQDPSGVLVLLQYITDARFLEPAESGDHENVDNTPVMSP